MRDAPQALICAKPQSQGCKSGMRAWQRSAPAAGGGGEAPAPQSCRSPPALLAPLIREPPSPQHPAMRHPQNLTIPRFRISKPNVSLAAANCGRRWLPGFWRGLPAPQPAHPFPPHSTRPPAPLSPRESSSIPPRSVIDCPTDTPPLTPNNKYQHFLSSTDTGVPSFGCAPPAALPVPLCHLPSTTGLFVPAHEGLTAPHFPTVI